MLDEGLSDSSFRRYTQVDNQPEGEREGEVGGEGARDEEGDRDRGRVKRHIELGLNLVEPNMSLF